MNIIVILAVVGIFYWMYQKSSGGNFTSMEKELTFDDVLYSEYGYITALVAKLAKSDGTVSELEEEFIGNIIDDICGAFGRDSDTVYEYVKEIFHEEQDVQDNVYEVAERLYQETQGQVDKHEKIIEFLVNLAFIDGEFHKNEQKVISEIARALHVNASTLERFIQQFRSFYSNRASQSSTLTLDSACRLLEVSTEVDKTELKKAYRTLVKQNHPDIVSGKGGSAEDIQQATRKLQDINEAYEFIKQQKGF